MGGFSWDVGEAIQKLEHQKKECIQTINSISKDGFDSALPSVKWNCSKYLRWRETTYNLINKFVGQEEAEKFNKVKNKSSYSFSDPYDFSAMQQDWNQLILYLHNLTGALANDEIEITSKAVEVRRYNILYKLFEVTKQTNKKNILIHALAKDLNIDDLIVGSTLFHWGTKKGFVKVNLIEKNSDTVELTSLGKSEIEARQLFLTTHAQPHFDVNEIYFSYAWADKSEIDESREKIVNDLYESLIKEDFKVKRDKVDLKYNGIISEFMQAIGRAKYIVVVISDKYLKSPNCMYELLEIYRKSNSDITQMKEKIFPIILKDAKIYDPIDRLNYIAFWRSKKEELDHKISEVGLEYATDIIGDFKIYREITNNIGILANLLKDMNTLNPVLLSQDNFGEIKRAIGERLALIKD